MFRSLVFFPFFSRPCFSPIPQSTDHHHAIHAPHGVGVGLSFSRSCALYPSFSLYVTTPSHHCMVGGTHSHTVVLSFSALCFSALCAPHTADGVNFIPSVCACATCITDRQSWNGKHNLPMCDVCCLADWQLRYHFPLVFIFFNRRLRDGQVLLNCGVFTEGTDIPRIDCVILARWGAAWLCGCAGAIAGARWRCCRGGVGRDGRCRCLVFFSVLFSAFTP